MVKKSNSNEIIVIKIFFLFAINPKILIKNKIVVALKKFNIFRVNMYKNLDILGFEPRIYELKVQCFTYWAIYPNFILRL